MTSPNVVDCGEHGTQRPAYICQHLLGSSGLGFFTPDSGDGELEGWCADCERVRAGVGEWNDESEKYAGITLVCERCFVSAYQRHHRCSDDVLNTDFNDGPRDYLNGLFIVGIALPLWCAIVVAVGWLFGVSVSDPLPFERPYALAFVLSLLAAFPICIWISMFVVRRRTSRCT